MSDMKKTKEQMVDELKQLRLQIAELEKAEDKHKRIVKALRESEELLSNTQKSANIGSWEWNLITGKAIWSKQLYRIYGRDSNLGIPDMESYLDSYHPDDRKPVQEAIDNAIKSNHPYRIDYRIFRENDGQERWIRSTGEIEKDDNGKPIRLLGMAQDITERKKAEDGLRLSELRLRSLIERTTDAMFCYEYDPPIPTELSLEEQVKRLYQGFLAECNDVCARSYGAKSTHEVVGKSLTELFGTTSGSLNEFFEAFIQSNYQVIDAVAAEILQDGTIRHYSNTGYGIIEEGKLKRIWGSFRDVTEPKLTEQALRTFKMAVNSSTDIVAGLDTNCKYLFANKAYLKMHQWDSEKIKGCHYREVIGEATYRRVKPHLDKCLKGQEVHFELTHEYPEIGVRHLAGSYYPLRSNEGEILGIVGSARDITERKQAEEGLQKSEERFKLFIDSSPDLLFLKDRDLRYKLLNKANADFFGAEEKDLIGKSDYDLMPEEFAAGCEASDREAIAKRQMVLTVEDIEDRAYETRKLPVFSGDTVIGVAGIIRDITDRKQADKALQESEEKYRTILDRIYEGYFEVDLAGNFTFFNEAMREILGYAAEEMLGLNNRKYMDKENAEKVFQIFNEVYRTGTYAKASNWQLIRKDGAKRFVETSVILIKDSSGKPIGFRGLARDITDRQQAEENLLQYKFMVESAHDAIFFKDLKSRYIVANKKTLESLGLSSDQVIGKNDYELMPDEEEARKNIEDDQKVFKTKKSQGIVKHMTGNDGMEYWFQALKVPQYDSKGNIVGLVGIARDISELKRAEAERAKLEDQLRQSQKMEAIGRLAGGVAHDFNNILTGIIGYAQIISSGLKPDDPLRADVQVIQKAGQRAADLTNQLLAFSRKQIIDPKVLQPNDILDQSQKMLKRVIGEDIDFAFTHGNDLWCIKADPTQLDQIFVNLAINARDAMPDGGKLSIETENVTLDEQYCNSHMEITPGDYVMLTVSDSGHGMDKETLQNIFEPFFTTKEKGKGTGLGLSTVYGIVKQNQGFIYVDSEPGAGTTFKLYFPAVMEEAKELTEDKIADMPTGTETILLVEDEIIVRDLVKEVLKQQGYEVIEAPDGAKAFRAYAKHTGNIDLLLSDVIMPTMNGCELHEKLLEIKPGLKALFMSGYTENVLSNGAMNKETTFIQKPFAIEALAKAVRKALDS